jgi:hypothetical protein
VHLLDTELVREAGRQVAVVDRDAREVPAGQPRLDVRLDRGEQAPVGQHLGRAGLQAESLRLRRRPRVALQDQHVEPGALQLERGQQAGRARTGHQDVRHRGFPS